MCFHFVKMVGAGVYVLEHLFCQTGNTFLIGDSQKIEVWTLSRSSLKLHFWNKCFNLLHSILNSESWFCCMSFYLFYRLKDTDQ